MFALCYIPIFLSSGVVRYGHIQLFLWKQQTSVNYTFLDISFDQTDAIFNEATS